MPTSHNFWESWFVWRDALTVTVLSAAALAYLGVWVVLKKVIYVPLALSQVSSLGLVVAFLATGWLGFDVHDQAGCGIIIDPAWISLIFALLSAFWFARPGVDGSHAVVTAYLLAGASVLIVGGFLRRDLHDLQSVLFGNAVLVETIQILYVGAAAVITTVIHGLFYRRFLFVSFDPDAAGAAGIRLFRSEIWLYATFALMISVATRAIGALSAFGLMILPALTGLTLGRGMRAAFLIAIASGILSAGFGYYLSFVWELPTGASMVALAGLLYLGAQILVLGRDKT
jgi:zinc transport system permease protein